jgi:hypothetical protein
LEDRRQHEAENDHGCNRKIKTEIFLFNPYIPGQAADPVKFIVKKIDQYPHHYDHQPNNNDVFAGIAAHEYKINPYGGRV